MSSISTGGPTQEERFGNTNAVGRRRHQSADTSGQGEFDLIDDTSDTSGGSINADLYLQVLAIENLLEYSRGLEGHPQLQEEIHRMVAADLSNLRANIAHIDIGEAHLRVAEKSPSVGRFRRINPVGGSTTTSTTKSMGQTPTPPGHESFKNFVGLSSLASLAILFLFVTIYLQGVIGPGVLGFVTMVLVFATIGFAKLWNDLRKY